MKNEKKINPEFFEMPIERLLTNEEADLLLENGIETKWVSCKECHAAGATTDDRSFCSLKCFCKNKDIDYNAMKLLGKEIFLEQSAQTGDLVMYNGEQYKVVSTDFTFNRVNKKFEQTYSYVLIGGGQEKRLHDLEIPLRKIGFSQELSNKKENGKDERREL